MTNFVSKIIVYLISFLISLYGLSAIDFNRLLKKNNVKEAWVLYFVLSICLAYLFGQFIISITYFFNK